MEQSIACFSRLFSLEENEQAFDILSDIRNIFCRKLLPGEPIILSEGQYRHVVLGFGKGPEVATIHYLVKDGRIRFMSVVIAAAPPLGEYLKQPLLPYHFSSKLLMLPEELVQFSYASGWRDLVSSETDLDTVRVSMDASRTRPAIGGTANQ